MSNEGQAVGFENCERCGFPAVEINDHGLCLRCWRGPAAEFHGPETPSDAAKRAKREAAAEVKRAKRAKERERRRLADAIGDVRYRGDVARGWVAAAKKAEGEDQPCGEQWAQAAQACSRVASAATDIARRSLPAQARTWLRRAAVWAQSSAVSARHAARALQREAAEVDVRFDVLVGEGQAGEASAPPVLRVVGHGEASA